MKKYVGLTLSAVFILLAAYSMTVLLCKCVSGTIGGTCGILILSFVLLCTVAVLLVVLLGFKRHRIGRFNQDILATIALFVLFMIAFLIPGAMSMQYVLLDSWFPLISKLVTILGHSAIGIHEVFLFLSMLCCGMTIGEDKNRKYYE